MYTRVSARTNVLQRCALFMHMTSLENFNILASQKVCGIPLKRNFPKARGQNRAVFWYRDLVDQRTPIVLWATCTVMEWRFDRCQNAAYHKNKKTKNTGACLWSKSKACSSVCDSPRFPLFRFLSHPLSDPVPLSNIPAGKLDFCATVDLGPHSVLKDRKRLFLYDTYELTFSQGRGTGWGHWTRNPPPHSAYNHPSQQHYPTKTACHVLLLQCSSSPLPKES